MKLNIIMKIFLEENEQLVEVELSLIIKLFNEH